MSSCCPKLGRTVGHFGKPARSVNTTFIHCTATSNKHFDADECNAYHLSLGWSCIGYHYLIKTDGTIQYGRDVERVPSAQSGYNTGSIAISLNGLKVSDFTEEQFSALRWLCTLINSAYGGRMRFRGHREVAAKECPVFDYRKVLGLDANGYMAGEAHPEPPTQGVIKMVRVAVDMATLGRGDEHPHVKVLQSLLVPLGGVRSIDGIFGEKTEAAVKQFQRDQGLGVDGICGRYTWERLFDAGDD